MYFYIYFTRFEGNFQAIFFKKLSKIIFVFNGVSNCKFLAPILRIFTKPHSFFECETLKIIFLSDTNVNLKILNSDTSILGPFVSSIVCLTMPKLTFENVKDYTRNGWRRCKTTLATSAKVR